MFLLYIHIVPALTFNKDFLYDKITHECEFVI
jgi:hypothetical protein